MPTPMKPVNVLKQENKSHRTKDELRQREKGEEALKTGGELKERPEVKNNVVAHKEFLRLNKLLAVIDKNDAFYTGIINRYCIIYAETVDFERRKERLEQRIEEFEDQSNKLVENGEMEWKEYYHIQSSFEKSLINLDRQLQTKRRMLLDIEKENIMTVAAGLRSIPKAPEKKTSALKEALSGK